MENQETSAILYTPFSLSLGLGQLRVEVSSSHDLKAYPLYTTWKILSRFSFSIIGKFKQKYLLKWYLITVHCGYDVRFFGALGH